MRLVLRTSFVLTAIGAASYGTDAGAVERFVDVPDAFESQGCQNSGCWSNHLRLADLDGDGDLDVIVPNYAGFFIQGTAQPLLIYFNDGDANFTDVSSTTVGNYIGRIRQVAIGDIDGDGDLDIYAPDGWNGIGGRPDALFINQGDGTFIDEAEIRLPNGQAFAGGVRFGDLDNDGDLDIFIADGYGQGPGYGGVARLLINDGTGVFTDASEGLPTAHVGFDPDDVDFIDFDGDFDLDVLINMHSGKSSLWRNEGDGTFTDVTDQWVNQPSNGYHYNPAVCDVDGDGDLDVWTDNMGPSYTEQLAINDGSGTFSDETVARVTGNINGADDNGVACADVDGDGDFDAVIFHLVGPQGATRVERVLYNDGSGNFQGAGPEWDEFTVTNDNTLWGEGGDLNGDGRLDWVTAQGEPSGPQRVYLGTEAVPVDANPPVIRAAEVLADVYDGDEPIARFAVSDEVVTDSGPWLDRAFVRISVDGAAHEEIEARFMGGDLYWARLPAQAAGVSVSYEYCAIDRQDNEGCSEIADYEVAEGMNPGEDDTGGEDETAGEDETGTASDASAGTMTGPDTGADAGATDGAEETGGTADQDGDGGGGCGCTTSPAPSRGLALLSLLALGFARRRRSR